MTNEPLQQTNEELILAFLADGADDFISGEALSDKLGLSRTAVWKYVESLRQKGYRIEAVPARGYRLVEVPDRITPLEIAPLLNTRDIGRLIHYRESVTSTNAVAFRMANEGASHGEVVIAEEQTEGKGRRGRSWISPAGLNLYFSVILRPDLPPQRAPEITLVAAVAAAEALRGLGAPAGIKWPNDLMIGDKKVGGILTELSSDPDRIHFAILGMGFNLNAPASQFPPEIAVKATSVAEAIGANVRRAQFAVDLWARLEVWLELHADEGFAKVREAWRQLCLTLGEEVVVRTGDEQVVGKAEDIDETGALVIQTADRGRQRVLAGDVEQVRRRPQPD
ncbi:MAG TPA: biotin--[acetyl-CoA-carboxylase] ligase [Myxococcaceae bacterium]|nr:biotin--[acetyl-CoA-carboxylase] ligase [Myxococcaceae bacterium]